MRIALTTPVRPGSTSGNDVTTNRWVGHLQALGHDVATVRISPDGGFDPGPLVEANLAIVLHARRGAAAARWWRSERGAAPLIVALAGTDLYADLPDDADAMWSISSADALVVLQEAAIVRLAGFDPALAHKATIIHQSVAQPLPERVSSDTSEFRVVLLSHLREVKDPLMCARAARHLPSHSRVVVHHVGQAHDENWEKRANEETESNPRYWWHGPLNRGDALELLATATVLACTSRLEGGANVVTEAIAMGVPVIGTRIDGNTGLLGLDYPGLVPVGDDEALAELLVRLEARPELLADLQARIDARHSITEPATERSDWAELLERLS